MVKASYDIELNVKRMAEKKAKSQERKLSAVVRMLIKKWLEDK